jgi:Ca-activated chloride channel family protein
MRFLALALTALLLLPAGTLSQDTTVRVTVRLVNVVAAVRDPGGQLTQALARADFEILDEGQPQAIRVFNTQSDVPLSIVLMVDASLSTAKELRFEQDSALRFIRAMLRPQDGISLFTFTHAVTQVVPFTNDPGRIEKGLRSIRPEGGTSLYDAIYLASGELKRETGRKALILITDGGDTTSSTTFHEALRAAQEADAVIYSVVILPIRNESFRDIGGEHALYLLSQGTGGRSFTPGTTAELDPVFSSISEELRMQYLLGYYAPSGLRFGTYRHIEVRVKKPGFTVQARQGYYVRDR